MQRIKGHSGVEIAVYEAGRAGAPAIVFIHGFSQAALSWQRQFDSPLANDFRLLAMDVRGHGASGKPAVAEAYGEARPYADDTRAVLDHFARTTCGRVATARSACSWASLRAQAPTAPPSWSGSAE